MGCRDDCNRPPILIHALRIQVVDAQSGDPLCDAQITLQLGETSEPLAANNCHPAGGSRPGTYHVTARQTGYQTAEIDVTVPEDDCGEAVPQDVTIELTPS